MARTPRRAVLKGIGATGFAGMGLSSIGSVAASDEIEEVGESDNIAARLYGDHLFLFDKRGDDAVVGYIAKKT